MYYLSSIDDMDYGEMESQLRRLFIRTRQIRRRISGAEIDHSLNRIQRQRCRDNLDVLDRLEADFHALGYREDVRHLYRRVLGLVRLDQSRLMEMLGHRRLGRLSIFTAIG